MRKNNKTSKSLAAPDTFSPAHQNFGDIRFRKLIENSHEGLSLLDKNLQIIYRSASAERINGWSKEDRAKYIMRDLIHPEDSAKVELLLNEVLVNPGISKICSFRSKHFSGHYIWLESVFTNLLDDPQIVAIVCNFRDISCKMEEENLLQQTIKELYAYKYALDESAIIAITDQKGVIKHVNDNFCRISKYSEAELIGQDHRIINSGYHDKEFIRNLWTVIGNGHIWHGEIKNIAKDGSYYWVDTTIVPFLNEKGKPYQYVAIRSDITERKLNEEKIAENQSFIKTITDNLPAMIAYWSADLICLFANKPYMDWFEKQPNEMLGINKRDLLEKEEFKLHESHIQNVLEGKSQSFERTFHKSGGKTIFTHTQYLPDKQNEKIVGFYSLIYDVTEIKLAEVEVKQKTEQIENILESITDGFFAVNSDLMYTYGNKRLEGIFGIPVSSILGKSVLEIFPGAIETDTYKSIIKVLKEKIPVVNEDYYAPLNLWTENRIFPAGDGVSMFIRDISKQKREEHHLRLLESVITNTTEAIMITEAGPINNPGQHIIYVNEAFTKMTGYSDTEIIGKSPRILQGPKSDRLELGRLAESITGGHPCEITTINYRKNGNEFWINLVVSPVMDGEGKFTHFIAIERDVTDRKNEELKQSLLTEISLIFNENNELDDTLNKVLGRLVDFGNFTMAEAWLIGTGKNTIDLIARFPKTDAMQIFYDESGKIKNLIKGEGLPGVTWEKQTIQFWNHLDTNEQFLRRGAAKNASLKCAYGLPLTYNGEVIGVLVLGLSEATEQDSSLIPLFKSFCEHFGAEVKRKQLELELNQVFNFTPDILCIANIDGYFKKVNPAMSVLLEYNEAELLSRPFMEFVHPLDKEKTTTELNNIATGKPTYYIENRYITKSGKTKWLAWTTTGASEQGILYCSAKDITDKKELEELLNKANALARIGGWELDLVNNNVYWSEITREIHEAQPGYHPSFKEATNFYKEGKNREIVASTIGNAVDYGTPADVELQIVTARGNTKWVRVIVEAEFANSKCLRVYGSIQDIDGRKKAEIAGMVALEERNTILESIDDAFFAVDKNWVVTYWNKRAEKILKTPKDSVLNHNLWEVFSESVDSESYKKYHEAIASNKAAHFEDFFTPLLRWFEISAYPSESGLSVYFKDISDRKLSDALLRELNENLRKQTKELAISNTELEQFAYVASHDLQEPLRMVTSFMTQLEKKYGDVVDEKGRQYIHFAVDGAKRMRQIILDLLEFSRVGRTDDDLEDVDFNKMLNEILALYRRQMEEAKAKVIFANLPMVQTLKTPVRQIFQNLISNSLKYQKPGNRPLIEIDFTETKSRFQFSVKDNGIGISPEYFDKIFIIFQRLHNKEEYSGTGMGLAIVKKIVENLGGKIWVESEEGKGSTFYFTLLKTNKT